MQKDDEVGKVAQATPIVICEWNFEYGHQTGVVMRWPDSECSQGTRAVYGGFGSRK